MRRPGHWLVYHLERMLLRGAHYHLMLMIVAVVGVAALGGLALLLMGEPEQPGEAVWWAFLRLTDPGYLGDDEGLGRRVVSTVVTVAGYVLFMGALIAILSRWLQQTIELLQRGETPIHLKNHLLVLGLTDRTPIILQEMLRSEERVARLLAPRGGRALRLVVLVEDLDQESRTALREDLGALWDDRHIFLRTGSPLVAEHLTRVAVASAAAILLPGDDDDPERDSVVVKTLLSLAAHPQVLAAERPPRVVAGLADQTLVEVVRPAYPGLLQLIPNSAVVSRMIAQNLRHLGLSWVLGELLAFRTGNDLLYRAFPELDGARFDEAALRLVGGVALGVVRREGDHDEPLLNPPGDLRLRADDKVVIIGRQEGALRLGPARSAPEPMTDALPPLGVSWPKTRRVLVLGWGPRALLLLEELDTYRDEDFEVDVFSMATEEERAAALDRADISLDRVRARYLTGDYTNPRALDDLSLRSYHNVVLLGRSWREDGESADAHTMLAYLILQSLLKGEGARPTVLVELMDPDNASLLADKPGEVILSPILMGNMMAHIALRSELLAVVDELFTVGGAEFHYRPAADYALSGETAFSTVQAAALARGELAVGVRISAAALDVRSDLRLAPGSDERFSLDEDSLLLVLTTARELER